MFMFIVIQRLRYKNYDLTTMIEIRQKNCNPIVFIDSIFNIKTIDWHHTNFQNLISCEY